MSSITINVCTSTLPITFFTASEGYRQPDMSRTAEEMSFHQILLVLDGSGVLCCRDKEYELSKGCAFYIADGVAYHHQDKGGLVTAFITARGEGMKALEKRYAENGFLFLDSIDTSLWVKRISDFLREYQKGMGEGRMSSLVYSFYTDFFEMTEGLVPSPLDRIIGYIETHLGEKLTLDSLSRIGGISVSKLCHDFKAKYGVTVVSHILDKRLKWAKSYIVANPSCLTKEVARLSGFEDVGYFCRAYKKKYGHTPAKNRD